MSDVTSQFMKTGLTEFILPGACNILIKPFIKMILGNESTTEMSRNHLSAFSVYQCGVFSQDFSTAALSGPLP